MLDDGVWEGRLGRRGGINPLKLGGGQREDLSSTRGLTRYFLPKNPRCRWGKRCWAFSSPFSLTLVLWPRLQLCQHPSTLLTVIAMRVTPYLVPFPVIDCIRASFYIKTEPSSFFPSYLTVLVIRRWSETQSGMFQMREDIMRRSKPASVDVVSLGRFRGMEGLQHSNSTNLYNLNKTFKAFYNVCMLRESLYMQTLISFNEKELTAHLLPR